MTKKTWESQAREAISSILESPDIHKALIHDLSQNILNYFNHRENISYGFTLDLLADQNRPFSVAALHPHARELEDLQMCLDEEHDVFLVDFQDVVVTGFSGWLTNNWPEIIKARLAVESKFSHPGDFVALRRFMVITGRAGINFYTKDSDGSGPDIIGGVVVTDLVHSDYEDIKTILRNIPSDLLMEVMKGSRDGVEFANWNEDVTDASKARLEFFGPAYASPFFKYIKTRKEAFSEALTELATKTALPLTLDLKFVANGDRLVFNIHWERKLPECFYDIANHKPNNRFM